VPGGAAARDTVGARLAALGVGTKPYFVPLSDLGIPGEGPDRPVTERLGAEVLALPMSSELNDEQAELVCVALERALG
jgi:dTDP-4-amino-4,6-dideoxygalactose transaminase